MRHYQISDYVPKNVFHQNVPQQMAHMHGLIIMAPNGLIIHIMKFFGQEIDLFLSLYRRYVEGTFLLIRSHSYNEFVFYYLNGKYNGVYVTVDENNSVSFLDVYEQYI